MFSLKAALRRTTPEVLCVNADRVVRCGAHRPTECPNFAEHVLPPSLSLSILFSPETHVENTVASLPQVDRDFSLTA